MVNIGNRQAGRIRGKNVIDVGYARHEISEGIKKAITPGFRESLRELSNPYGAGQASGLIVKRLKTVSLDPTQISKTFVDLPV